MPSLPWLPNRTRANVAIASIALFAASSIAAAIVTGFTLAHFGEIEDTTTLDRVWTVVTFTSVGAYVACGIAFLFWFRRALLGLGGGDPQIPRQSRAPDPAALCCSLNRPRSA
jgi:hypothetical protein